jgi:hypothetical protein
MNVLSRDNQIEVIAALTEGAGRGSCVNRYPFWKWSRRVITAVNLHANQATNLVGD